jgi:hypothetical protein
VQKDRLLLHDFALSVRSSLANKIVSFFCIFFKKIKKFLLYTTFPIVVIDEKNYILCQLIEASSFAKSCLFLRNNRSNRQNKHNLTKITY